MLGVKPLARWLVRAYLDVTSGEDKPLQRAPIVRRTGGQAVECVGGSRHPSCQGTCRPANTPGACAACFVETHVARRARERRRDTPCYHLQG
jgi:hypothetical protein